MTTNPDSRAKYGSVDPRLLELLRGPGSTSLHLADNALVDDKGTTFEITPEGIPVFARSYCSEDARIQEAHYDRVAAAYVRNLGYPHTLEYMAYLDRALLGLLPNTNLGLVAELCCGRGEALRLLGSRLSFGVGVDVSLAMLRVARTQLPESEFAFLQADVTRLPFKSGSFDNVLMLGGIHHINDRRGLFLEVARILKPGGGLYFREPVSDFPLWQGIRSIIYRVAPSLDRQTEKPLHRLDTIQSLEDCGLLCDHWETHGVIGYCIFMNSHVLYFNRAFQYVPKIRTIVGAAARLDEWITTRKSMMNSGLQVIGRAIKA